MNQQDIEGDDSPSMTQAELDEYRLRMQVHAEVMKMGPSVNNFLDEDDGYESKLRQKIMIFGKDYSTVPCFRNTFLYGLLSFFGSGIGTFAFTSKPILAQKVAFSTMFAVIGGYWATCRWRYSYKKFETLQLQYLLQQRVLLEGTDRYPEGMDEDRVRYANLDSPKDDIFLNPQFEPKPKPQS